MAMLEQFTRTPYVLSVTQASSPAKAEDLASCTQDACATVAGLGRRWRRWGAGVLVACLCLNLQPALLADCSPPPNALINWWPGEGNGTDVGGVNAVSIISGTTFATGIVGLSFRFDGLSGGLEVGAQPIPPPWTAEVWVNRQASPNDSAVLIGDAATAIKLEQFPDTKKVGITQWGVKDHSFAYEAPIGVWVHMAVVGTDTAVQLYVNGTLRDTLAVSVPLPRGRIGNDISGRFTKRLKGQLDEMSLYSRALTQSEIQTIYNAGAAGKCQAQICVTPPNGLINWWPANGNTEDVAGTDDMTLVNGTDYAVGHVGSAFHFDGVNDRINIGASAVPVPWTAEFWINRELSPDDSAILIGDAAYALKLEQYPNTKKVGFTVWDVRDYSFNYIAPVGQWAHLTFVGTAADMKLYVNGVLQDTIAATMSLPRRQVGDDIVGRYTKRLKGLVDEASVYNRALSATEIASLYQAGTKGKCPLIPPPPNDDFANRQFLPLPSSAQPFTGSNLGATLEPGEPHIVGPTLGGHSVWYAFAPSVQGMVRVVLSSPHACCDGDSTYNMLLGHGNAANNVSPIATPILIDNGGLNTRDWAVYGDLRAGQEYQLAVDGQNSQTSVDSGFIRVWVRFVASPANDNFAGRSVISQDDYSANISLLAASQEFLEPDHGGGEGSLWWQWTAPADGQATLRATQSGNFVPFLGVYQGNQLGNLLPVTVTSEIIGHTRQTTFSAVQGQTYALAMSGAKYDRVEFPQTSDDNFSAGRFEFTFATLGLRFSGTTGTTNTTTKEVSFNSTARVVSSGTRTSGPLRLRLIANPGSSSTEFGGCNGCTGVSVPLGTFTPLPNGQVPPGLSTPFPIAGTCPAPVQQELFSGQGYEVFGLLEEQFGTLWIPQDKRLILQGVWPNVGGFGGPGAGIVRLEASLSGSTLDKVQSVEILGPSAIYGGDQRAYVGLAHFQFNGDVMFSNTVWTAPPFTVVNGVLQSQPVAAQTDLNLTVQYGFGSKDYSTNRLIQVFPGARVVPQVPPFVGGRFGLSIQGIAGRDHVVEATANLNPVQVWIPLATNKPPAGPGPLGVWQFSDPNSGAFPKRFYRVRAPH